MVKWLRHHPLKVESGVQFPLGVPNFKLIAGLHLLFLMLKKQVVLT